MSSKPGRRLEISTKRVALVKCIQFVEVGPSKVVKPPIALTHSALYYTLTNRRHIEFLDQRLFDLLQTELFYRFCYLRPI